MSAFNKRKFFPSVTGPIRCSASRTTRDPGFRFQRPVHHDGPRGQRPAAAARLQLASANHEEELEFFSIKVADGPLTSRLQKIREGDTILVGRKATGTLITDNLLAGQPPAAALDRNRPGAVREPDQGSGGL